MVLNFKCDLHVVCGSLTRSRNLKSFDKNKASLALSGSKVPRDMEYDFLTGIGDLLALLWSFLMYLGAGC